MSPATDTNALCFGEGLRAEGERCRAGVTSEGITLSFPAPRDTSETAPFARLRVRPGGFEADRLVVEWSGDTGERILYLEDQKTIEQFGAFSPAALRTGYDQARRRMRRSRRSAFVVLGVFLALTAALLTVLVLTFDTLIGAVVGRLPRSWDKALGQSAYTALVEGQPKLDSGPSLEAVEMITRRLEQELPAGEGPMSVTVVEGKDVNAFALPGGHIVVYTGLLEAAVSAEEVAGVLSHEISHVVERHSIHRLVRSAGISLILTILVGDQAGMAEAARTLGQDLVNLSYDREQETEADLEGLRLLVRAGVSPEGMVTFFERLAREEPRMIPILSTHPVSAGRAARLRAEIDRMKPETEALPIDWNAVRASLAP